MKSTPLRPDVLSPTAPPVATSREAVNDESRSRPKATTPPASARTSAAPSVSARAAAPSASRGQLDWRVLVDWLLEDGVISAEDSERTIKRFAGTQSSQHPLVRLASAGLTRRPGTKVLDVENLTEWLAARCGLPGINSLKAHAHDAPVSRDEPGEGTDFSPFETSL